MEKEVTLNQNVGSAKKGDVFVQGLHGVPESETFKDMKPEDFYWERDSKKEDNSFLMYRWIVGKDFNYTN